MGEMRGQQREVMSPKAGEVRKKQEKGRRRNGESVQTEAGTVSHLEKVKRQGGTKKQRRRRVHGCDA